MNRVNLDLNENNNSRKIRIKPYLLVAVKNNIMEIGTSTKLRYRLHDSDKINMVKEIFPLLQRGDSLQELTGMLNDTYGNDAAVDLLQELMENKLLEYVPGDTAGDFEDKELEMYSRNLLFYDMFAGIGKDALDLQRDLKRSHVVIFGLHGVGAQVLLMLNQTGIGSITGVDSGKVNKFHLNSKILYQTQDIGQEKGEVLERRIKELNPFNTFRYIDYNRILNAGRKDFEERLCSADCVVFCLDAITGIEDLIEDVCVPKKIPYLIVGKKKNTGFVGPLFITDKTACHLCDEKLAKEIFEHQSSEPGLTKKIFSFNKAIEFSPIDTLLGNYAVADIVRYLTKFEKPALLNKQFQYDEKNYVMANKAVYRNHQCNNCKKDNTGKEIPLIKLNAQLAIYENSFCQLADYFWLRNKIDGNVFFTEIIGARGVRIQLSEPEHQIMVNLKNGCSPKEAVEEVSRWYDNVNIDVVPLLSFLLFAGFIKGIDGYRAEVEELPHLDRMKVDFDRFREGKERDYYALVNTNNEKLLMPEPSIRAVRMLKEGMSVGAVREALMKHYETEDIDINPLMGSLFEKGFIRYMTLESQQ